MIAFLGFEKYEHGEVQPSTRGRRRMKIKYLTGRRAVPVLVSVVAGMSWLGACVGEIIFINLLYACSNILQQELGTPNS